MQPPKTSLFKIDRIFSGEIPATNLNPTEQAQLAATRAQYANWQGPLEAKRPPFTGNRANTALFKTFGISSFATAGLAMVALAAISAGVVLLTDHGPTVATRPKAAVPAPSWHEVNSHTTIVEFEVKEPANRGATRRALALQPLRAGDCLNVRIVSSVSRLAVVEVYSQAIAGTLAAIFPESGTANDPVMLLPQWDMPFCFLIVNPADSKSMVVTVASAPLTPKERDTLIAQLGKRNLVRFEHGDVWVELHRVSTP